MNIVIEIIGKSPLLMHNPRMADPDYELNREAKNMAIKRKKTDDDFKKIARLEWYGGLYEENGIVVQPTSKLRKCIINAAKITKQGKAMERALWFSELNVPLMYDGPKNIDELYADPRFHSRLSVGIGNKRVMRVRPKFFPWSMRVNGLFIPDAGINFDDFVKIVQVAGMVERIGDNRVNGYGAFEAVVEKVK